MPKYYFAGGLYPSAIDGEPKQFKAVSPKGGLPYIWRHPEHAKGVHHHASVYELSEDMSLGVLRVRGSTLLEPEIVRIDTELQSKLKEAIKLFDER